MMWASICTFGVTQSQNDVWYCLVSLWSSFIRNLSLFFEDCTHEVIWSHFETLIFHIWSVLQPKKSWNLYQKIDTARFCLYWSLSLQISPSHQMQFLCLRGDIMILFCYLYEIPSDCHGFIRHTYIFSWGCEINAKEHLLRKTLALITKLEYFRGADMRL